MLEVRFNHLIRKKVHFVVERAVVKLVAAWSRLTALIVLWPRKFIKQTILLIVIVNAWVTSFLCKVRDIQYVSSTVDRFWFKRNNFKSCQRNLADGETPSQNYFQQHFLSEGQNGLKYDCEIIFINKMDPSDPTRKEFF